MRHLERFLAGIPIFIVLLAVSGLLVYIILNHITILLGFCVIGLIYYLGKTFYDTY